MGFWGQRDRATEGVDPPAGGPAASDPVQPPPSITRALWLGRVLGIAVLVLGAAVVLVGLISVVRTFLRGEPGSAVWGTFGLLLVALFGGGVVALGLWLLEAVRALRQHRGQPLLWACGVTVVVALAGTPWVAQMVALIPVVWLSTGVRVALVVAPVVIIALLMSQESADWRRRPSSWPGMWRSS